MTLGHAMHVSSINEKQISPGPCIINPRENHAIIDYRWFYLTALLNQDFIVSSGQVSRGI
jgi:hypothetical protein